MTRTAPIVTINVPNTSQFYDKAVVHENKHVANYAPSALLGDLWTVSGLFSLLSPLTDSTEQGLITKIATTTKDWDDNQYSIYDTRKKANEQSAYGVSDPVGPQYLAMWQCQESRYR